MEGYAGKEIIAAILVVGMLVGAVVGGIQNADIHTDTTAVPTEKIELNVGETVIEDISAPQIEESVGRLDDLIIGIDPGHQEKGNYEKEQVAPGSKEKKAKVSSGTQGVSTRVPEYVVNLDVSMLLKEALISEGAQVVMSRESHDVDISNIERAVMMNEAGCDLVLRIHCNGSENKSAKGIGLYVRATGDCAEESYAAAEFILSSMVEKTEAENDGIFKRDTYTGLNWSEVPCILVEMGFMSNKKEDEKLNDPEYQALLVEGMVEGICGYFGR